MNSVALGDYARGGRHTTIYRLDAVDSYHLPDSRLSDEMILKQDTLIDDKILTHAQVSKIRESPKSFTEQFRERGKKFWYDDTFEKK